MQTKRGKDDGLEKMIQTVTRLYPMFLKPLDEEWRSSRS